jgi:redox-regulated HSP33 family molecular chaperone
MTSTSDTPSDLPAKSRLKGAFDKSRGQIADARANAKTRRDESETFAGVTLWADGRVESKQGGGGPVAGARATVETQGQIRGRRTVKTLGLHQKKIDEREVFLTIEGQGWAISVQVDADKGGEARAFAAKINAAGMG